MIILKAVRLRDRQSGFGLVEVIVAMLIASAALLALASVSVSTVTLQRNTESRMEYVSVGEAKLDQLRSYAALRAADTVQLSIGGSLVMNAPNHFTVMTSSRGRQYRVRWQVFPGVNATRDVMMRVAPLTPGPSELPYMDLRALLAME